MSKRRVRHASVVRANGQRWCLCGYQAPRQYRPGSPKAKQAVDQHIDQHTDQRFQRGKLIAQVDQVVDGNSMTFYNRWNGTWILPTWVPAGTTYTITIGP